MTEQEEQKIIKWGQFAGTFPLMMKKMRALKKYIKMGVYFEAEEMDFKTIDLLASQRKLHMVKPVDRAQPFMLLTVYGPKIHQDARQKILKDEDEEEMKEELYAVVARNKHDHVTLSDFASLAQTKRTLDSLIELRNDHDNLSMANMRAREQELILVKLVEVVPSYEEPMINQLKKQLQSEINLCSARAARSRAKLIELAAQIHSLENTQS